MLVSQFIMHLLFNKVSFSDFFAFLYSTAFTRVGIDPRESLDCCSLMTPKISFLIDKYHSISRPKNDSLNYLELLA